MLITIQCEINQELAKENEQLRRAIDKVATPSGKTSVIQAAMNEECDNLSTRDKVCVKSVASLKDVKRSSFTLFKLVACPM